MLRPQVTTGLIAKSKNSHAQYETYLAEKRKLECRMMETESARKEELEKKDKLADVERDIGVLRNGLKMAENIIKEGNDEVQARCLKNVSNQDVITQASLRVLREMKNFLWSLNWVCKWDQKDT